MAKRTGIVLDECYTEHDTGFSHPESPERISSLIDYLTVRGTISRLVRITPEKAALQWLEEVHDRPYIDFLKASCSSKGLSHLDPDTVVSERSFDTALFAVGGVIKACHYVMTGRVDNAFCAVRPPGHHAERSEGMGFCIVNNVAIAASYLLKRWGLGKVSIIDWDVHHGNGIQHAFYGNPSVLYVSIHQFPFYPGTGNSDEKGEGGGKGSNLNLPVSEGLGDRDYIKIFCKDIKNAVHDFRPSFILLSAGFDAHREDPLSGMNISEDGFSEMTFIVKRLADECCNGRLVSVLEGGYNLHALRRSVNAHLLELMR